MAKRPVTCPTALRLLLRYDAETGILVWRARSQAWFSPTKTVTAAGQAKSWNSKNAGKPALRSHDGNGYAVGGVLGERVKAHRVAWAIHYGEWPHGHIDHVNGDRSDNRMLNLRIASIPQNAWNSTSHAGSSSAFKGVTWHKRGKRWMAQIGTSYLGLFKSEMDAARAYDKAALAKYGEYARVNFEGTEV